MPRTVRRTLVQQGRPRRQSDCPSRTPGQGACCTDHSNRPAYSLVPAAAIEEPPGATTHVPVGMAEARWQRARRPSAVLSGPPSPSLGCQHIAPQEESVVHRSLLGHPTGKADHGRRELGTLTSAAVALPRDDRVLAQPLGPAAAVPLRGQHTVCSQEWHHPLRVEWRCGSPRSGPKTTGDYPPVTGYRPARWMREPRRRW